MTYKEDCTNPERVEKVNDHSLSAIETSMEQASKCLLLLSGSKRLKL